MRCIVTGCAGFIGSHLTEALLKRGDTVYGVDNFHRYYDKKIKLANLQNFKDNPNFIFAEQDILSESFSLNVDNDVDTVFHTAAIAGVRYSVDNPSEYFLNNVIGTQRIIQMFRDAKFIYASSSSVYGHIPKEKLPVKETMEPRPISPYGLSKLQAEQICSLYSKIYGTKTCILRYFTVYGPRQRPDEVFTKFINLALHHQLLTIYGDGNMTRDFTYVSDVVEGTVRAAEHGSGIYNIGSGSSVTVNEMVSVMSKLLGDVRIKYVPVPVGDVHDTLSDITKSKHELGYFPKVDLLDGIRSCIEWYKNSLYASDLYNE